MHPDTQRYNEALVPTSKLKDSLRLMFWSGCHDGQPRLASTRVPVVIEPLAIG